MNFPPLPATIAQTVGAAVGLPIFDVFEVAIKIVEAFLPGTY